MFPKILATNAETVYLTAWVWPREFCIPDGLEAARAAPGWENFASGRRRVERPGFTFTGPVLVDQPDGGHRRSTGDIHFQVSPGGSAAGFHYVLMNEDLTIQAAKTPSPESPSVYIQLRAQLIWAVGWTVAVEYARDLAQAMFGRFNKFEMSRVDLTLDIDGWNFCETDAVRFVGRPRNVHKHFDGQEEIITARRIYSRPKYTGLTLGPGSDLQCRIYDKTEEIRTQSCKKWMFPLWKKNGWNGAGAVWRVEFQLRREILVELGIGHWTDFAERIQGAWDYLTQKWLRLAVPKSDGYRKFEWETDPVWQVVQSARFGENWGMLTRKRRDEATAEKLKIMLRGVGSTMAAKMNVEDDPGAFLNMIAGVFFADDANVMADLRRKLVKYQGGQVLRYNTAEDTPNEKNANHAETTKPDTG